MSATLTPVVRPAVPPRTTPSQLRGMLVAVGLLAAFAAVIVESAVWTYERARKAIDAEAVPSIVAAHRAKAGLAAMHALTLRGLLGGPPPAADYKAARDEVAAGLLKAAETITHGNPERDQIRRLIEGLADYEAVAATARTLADRGDRPAAVLKIRAADAVLHAEVFGAAGKLDKINEDELTDVYRDQGRWGQAFQAMVFFAGLALVGMLVRVQVFVRQRFRRLSSPPLVAATALAVGLVAVTMYGLNAGGVRLKQAKEDSFDSINRMWKAKADGFAALADARLRLLDPDPERVKTDTDRIDKAIDEIGGKPDPIAPGTLAAYVRSRKAPEGLGGHLKEAVGNVTAGHAGEAEAVADAIAAFIDSADRERAARTADPAAAAKLVTGDGPGTLTEAFARFDAAADRVIAINQAEFDAAARDRSPALLASVYLTLPVMLAVFVLTWVGLHPRMREYTF